MNSARFTHLLSPFQVGPLNLKNRIVMPAMGTNYADREGYVTEQIKLHYEKRARGGVGLIITEYTCVDCPEGRGSPNQLCCYDDRFIPGLSELVKVIHRHGARVVLQLCHSGRNSSEAITGCQLVAPSALAAPGMDMPRELSIIEIGKIIEKFAAAAVRAVKAGFDGLELHATHGYLLHGFTSAFSNVREDSYGGNLKNRSRFLLETIRAIKEKVGPEFPVWPRFTAREFNVPHGITLEESRPLARWLEEAGVAALNVSATNENTRGTVHMAWTVFGERLPRPPMAHPHGYLIPLAAEIKKVVNVPVIAIGRISPEAGEEAIMKNQVDLVAMGRQILCDPETPNKLASRNRADIRPCIGCNECLQRYVSEHNSIACSVNPVVGREEELHISPTPRKKKRVVIVGGGAAGLEASEGAALYGHEVILLEKRTSLGGQMITASLPPYKGVLNELIAYLTDRMQKLGVQVKLGTEATRQTVIDYQPDAVIVATGVKRRALNLLGAEKMITVDAEEALEGKEVGETVVVIGGGLVGCEVAEFLAEKGKKVTIVEMQDSIAIGMDPMRKGHMLNRMNKQGITILLNATAIAVTTSGLIFSSREGRREILPCDTIVMATTPEPNQDLYRELRGSVAEIYLVGDSVTPQRISDAMLGGFRAGLKV